MPLSKRRAVFGPLLLGFWSAVAGGQAASSSPGATCTELLQKQDAKAIAACKKQLDEAESAPPTERMARMVANDEYGIALLADAHDPKQALDAFNREIALLPASTVSLTACSGLLPSGTAPPPISSWISGSKRPPIW